MQASVRNLKYWTAKIPYLLQKKNHKSIDNMLKKANNNNLKTEIIKHLQATMQALLLRNLKKLKINMWKHSLTQKHRM